MRIASLVVVIALTGCRDDADLVALRSSVGALEDEVIALQTDLSAATERIASLEAENAAQATTLDTLRADLDEVSGGTGFTELSVDVAELGARTDALEDAGFATETWVEAQAYGAASDVAAHATRLAAIESAGYATEAWVGQNFATQSTVAAVQSQTTAHAAAITTLDARVDPLETTASTHATRLGALEAADFATEVWVTSRGYAAAADVVAHGTRITALEAADTATESWVMQQGFASDADLRLLEAEVGSLDTDLALLESAVGDLEGSDFATEAWVLSHGYLQTANLWDVGNGLEVVAGTLQVDELEIQGLAEDAAYHTPAELRAVLDAIYVEQGGTIDYDLLLDAGLQIGDAVGACDTAGQTGLLRYRAGRLEVCSGGTWKLIVTTSVTDVHVALGSDGVRTWSDGTLAQSCEAYRRPSAGHVYSGETGSGAYRIAPPTGPSFAVDCDMDFAGGGWTLVGRGIGGNPKGWMTTTADIDLTQAVGGVGTFKFSDTKINAIPKTRYRFTGIGEVRQDWYWSGTCVYGQLTTSTGVCNTSYDTTQLETPYAGTANGGHNGLGDWVGASRDHLHTSHASGQWYIRSGPDEVDGPYCNGTQNGCDVELYVR